MATGILVVLLPIVIVLTSVRILLLTAKGWMQIEYNLPGFPQDRYGFSLEDRLYWASIDIEFLLNEDGMEYFDDLRLEDGTPMHNERELRHMEDVKHLMHVAWNVWGVGFIIVILLIIMLWRVGGASVALQGLMVSSRGMIILMVVFSIGVAFSFGVLFVGFHRIFFESSTWIFPYSDTFIRLYPERFWRDTFVYVVIVTLFEAIPIFLAARFLSARIQSD
jgi:integral membrane protein (TIGR01906 family)